MSTYTTGDNTKMNIVDAAGELAAEHGFANVSTRMVADHAGENIGSIHYHFGGKDGLFEAVVREAISCCLHKEHHQRIDVLDAATVQPAELTGLIRSMVAEEISDLFRADRPIWHSQVIYQLLQHEDALFDLFENEVMNPSMQAMGKLLHLIDPSMDAETVHLHICLMKMPVFDHANYRKALLRNLKSDAYSEDYLQKMEDMIVKQTQLLLGLPLDK